MINFLIMLKQFNKLETFKIRKPSNKKTTKLEKKNKKVRKNLDKEVRNDRNLKNNTIEKVRKP